MKKINCNIIKDLMVSYLDGICSEETGMLVDEHLKVCEECRKFLEIMRAEDMSSGVLELRHLKKMKFVMKMRSLMIFFVPFVLSILAFCETIRMYTAEGIIPVQIFYFAAMPVLMVCFAAAFSENKKFSFEKSIAFSVVSVIALVFISAVGAAVVIFKGNIPVQPEYASDFMKISCISVILIETVSLLFHAFCEKRKRSFLLQSFAWLGLYFAMMLGSIMSFMSDTQTLVHRIVFGFVFLAVEFLAVNFVVKIIIDRQLSK